MRTVAKVAFITFVLVVAKITISYASMYWGSNEADSAVVFGSDGNVYVEQTECEDLENAPFSLKLWKKLDDWYEKTETGEIDGQLYCVEDPHNPVIQQPTQEI